MKYLALFIGIFVLPSLVFAAQSVIVPYNDSHRPIGYCWADPSISCSSPGACPVLDYCVHGANESNTSTACYSEGANCITDITFFFDKDYQTGTFIDGQTYVVADASGNVKITNITPEHTSNCLQGNMDSCFHGAGFDLEAGENFNDINPSWPHTINVSDGVPSCLLKVVNNNLSGNGGKNAFLHAGMLTVVKTAPPANAFRPNCMGERKIGYNPYYTTSNVDLSKIPNLTGPIPGDGPGIADIEAFWTFSPHVGYQRRNSQITGNITLNQGTVEITKTPFSNKHRGRSHGYHPARTFRTNAGLLRMMFSDFTPVSNSSHANIVYHAIQNGIDKIGAAYSYSDHPEVESMRTKNFAVPMMFAAFMLEKPELFEQITWEKFVEKDTINLSPKPGVGAIWGNMGTGEDTHWANVISLIRANYSDPWTKYGGLWQGDPYGYADQLYYGYMRCCSVNAWESGVLVTYLLQMQSYAQRLDIMPWLEFHDRYSAHGHLALPDPCAPAPSSVINSSCVPPNCPDYGVTWGPAPGNSADCPETRSCECIKHNDDPNTVGRSPWFDGSKLEWGWVYPWNDSMWDNFRNCSAPLNDDGTPSSTYPCAGMASAAPPECPDGICNGTENCDSCPEDCGICPECGDEICNGNEDCNSCEQDCGTCTECGDGIKNGTEECDGNDFGTETCITKGFESGDLICAGSCTIDTLNCISAPVCDNDGTCEAGENPSNCPNDCIVPSGNLVTYYPFEVDAVDASGNGNDGTVSGAIITTGQIGNAFSFDGLNDYISFTSSALDTLTIAAWVKADSPGESDYPRIIDTPAYTFYFRNDNQSLSFLAQHEGQASYQTARWHAGTVTFDGTWYHVAVTYDSSLDSNDPILYIDGQAVTTIEDILPTGNMVSNTGTGYIGTNPSSNRSWDGEIDEVYIYDNILSPSEILALYQGTPSTAGDLNNDLIVDIFDLVIIGKNFGTTVGPNHNSDTNDDEECDIIDLLKVAQNFGNSYI